MKLRFAATLLILGSLSVASAEANEKPKEKPIFDRLNRLETLGDQYFNKIVIENKSYAEVLDQTLMDPIDYTKFNANLKRVGDQVAGYSQYVKALQLKLDSKLSGRLHRAASWVSPQIVPYLPSKLSGGFKLELSEAKAPGRITEFSIDFANYNGPHWRGLYGDALAINISVKADSSLAILKKMFKDGGIYEACRQEVKPDELNALPELAAFFRLGCSIASGLESTDSFTNFIKENKEKFKAVKALADQTNEKYGRQLKELLREWVGALAGPAVTVSKFLYSYGFKAALCQDRHSQGDWSLRCRPNITIFAETDLLAGDADLGITLYENQLAIGFQSDVNVFASNVSAGEYRKDAVRGLYAFFKVMEQANADELDAIAEGMTKFLDEALKYLDKNFADEILLEIKPKR